MVSPRVARAGPKSLATMEAGSKSFGFVDVFRNVDLDVHPGSVTAITGAVGTGKTTLLRCLAGVEPLTTGRLDLRAPVVGLVLTAGQAAPTAVHVDIDGPRLVLADEPTYAPAAGDVVDRSWRAFVTRALRDLAKAGHAVVVGTHDGYLSDDADEVLVL